MIFTKREVVQSEGSSLFLKLKDGESATGVFRGEIFEFYSKWVGNRSQVTNALDQEGKARFRLNFVMKDGGRFTAKIWEFGVAVYNQLGEINEEYPLEETKVKITRRGTSTETTYTILPLLKDKISDAAKKEIELTPLNILEHKDASMAG